MAKTKLSPEVQAILNCKNISLDQFFEKYKPVKNHFVKDSSYDGCMFETYGKEWEHVKQQPANNVWTILDGEGRHLVISSGLWFINRIGYLITEIPFEGLRGGIEIID